MVISIIALLVSILMPALANARKQAKNLLCATNMHQWGIAVQLYASDNDGYFPYNGKDSYGESWDIVWVHPTTIQFFNDYLLPLRSKAKERDNDILFCPTNKIHRVAQARWPETGIDTVAMGMVGYWVYFGNDMTHLTTDHGGAVAVDGSNVLNWACRKKLGGRYRKGPILSDCMSSIAYGIGSDEQWVDPYWGVSNASHAGRKNNIPEGGNFLFEDGAVIWYNGIDSADGQSDGEIGPGLYIDNKILAYGTLPGIR